MLWPDQQGGRRVDEGVAIITMSSNVGFNLTMQRRGLPVAYMVSLGNKLKFDLHDAIHTFARQDRVTALGLFLETMPDPQAFQEAVNIARELGKPIVAMKVGRSEVAQKMVLSHTASLAGSDVLVSALFERLGVARVDSLEAIIEALKVLHVLGPLKGGRIAAMSTSGGDLTLLADGMGTSGSWLPIRSISRCSTGMTRNRMRRTLLPFCQKTSMLRCVCSITPGKTFVISRPGVGPKGVLCGQHGRPAPRARCWRPFQIRFRSRSQRG
jgi:acyl-CoA synthetase (NDP forming)